MTFRFKLAAALAALMAPGLAVAEDPRTAPGGLIDPTGVFGAYSCSDGPSRTITFRIADFQNGQYRIEETHDGQSSHRLERYSWQLATATLARERVSPRRAFKFRRLNGSLRTLHELIPGQKIAADYAEAPLDGRSQPLEWRYDIAIGQRAASFAPGGLGEIEVVPVEETRTRFVDGQGRPLPLQRAGEGLAVRETGTTLYAPDLGVALRYERMRDGRPLEACSLSEYRRP